MTDWIETEFDEGPLIYRLQHLKRWAGVAVLLAASGAAWGSEFHGIVSVVCRFRGPP